MNEMASNVLTTLCEKLRTKTFSLEIDESTLPDNQALLPSYVRSIDNEKICQYYSVQIKKLSQKVLQFTICFSENNILLINTVLCATDGAH